MATWQAKLQQALDKKEAGLDLSSQKIDAAGARIIAKALAGNRALQTLDLRRNSIGSDGAKALAEALKVNATLLSLDLSAGLFATTTIGSEGAKALADALKENKSLKEIGLRSNDIGDDGARALAEALKENKSLTWVDAGSNSIGDVGAKALAGVLKANRTLQTLYLGGNDIGDYGSKALADALKVNATLQTLYLYSNDIKDDGARAIAEALKVNQKLTNLSGVEHADIPALLERNKKLAQEREAKQKADPSVLPTQIPSAAPQAAASDWQEHSDPATGKKFYFNTKTKVSTWDKPVGYRDSAADEGRLAAERDRQTQAENAERDSEEKQQRETERAAALERELRATLASEWAAEKRAMEQKAETERQKAAAEKLAMEQRLAKEQEERKQLEASHKAAPPHALTLDREVDITVLHIDTSPMIGEGGFGRVYKCTWRGGPVAVKTLIATGSTSEMEAFKHEIALVLSLRDARLVTFKGACTAGPRLALIMEWLDGGSLAQALYPEAKEAANCNLTMAQKFQIAISVCEALVYLHATDGGDGQPQILHRDLKPENIMLTRSGDAKLTDFGLSRVKQTSSRTRTRSGGTAAYMAPECYDDDAKLDEKIDLYALGVVLNEMFGGQRPFDGLNQMQIMRKVDRKQHPDIPAEMPPGLAQLCEDCMQYEPAKRPSASAVLSRLQELRDSAAIENRAPWALPLELMRESLKWQVKDEGLRFAELNPTASATQHTHVEWIRSICGPNVKVTRVIVVENKALEERFAGQFGALKRLCTQSWLGKGAVQKDHAQKQVLNAQLSRRLRDLPGSGMRGIGWMFNGTSEQIAWRMCTSGIVNFKALDAGYFGSGCYVTPQAEYATDYPTDLAKTAPNERGEWALVMTWALVGNAYCITRGADYKKPDESSFFGVPMDKQYDTHFVHIDPALEYQAMDPTRPPKQVFEEIVVKNEAQLLPRYIVFFAR